MTLGTFLFSLQGRIGRKPFWIFTFLLIVLSLLVGAIEARMVEDPDADPAPTMLSTVFSLVILWPSIAVSVKRWHDRDKSGWWVLIGFIPVIGWIWALIETGFLPGTPGDNRFGPPFRTD